MADLGDLVVRVGADVEGFQESIGGLAEHIIEAVTEMSPEIAGLIGLVAGIGTAAFDAGLKFEDAFNSIIQKTGATGEDLAKLKEDFTAVFTSVPEDGDKVATVLAEVSRRLDLTGDSLVAVTKNFLDLGQVTGDALGALTTAGAQAFNAWALGVDQFQEKQDMMLKLVQATGASATETFSLLASGHSTLVQLGLDYDTASAFIAQLQKVGPGAEGAIKSLGIAVRNLSKDGIDTKGALQDLIAEIKDAPTDTIAAADAIAVFGRNGAAMAEQIRSGKFDLDALMETVRNSKTTVEATAESTESLEEKFSKLWHTVLALLEPFGSVLVDAATTLVVTFNNLLTPLKSVSEEFGKLPTPVKDLALALAVALPALALMTGAEGFVGAATAVRVFALEALPGAISALGTLAVTTIPAVLTQLGYLTQIQLSYAIERFGIFATTTIPAVITALATFASTTVPAAITAMGTFVTTTIPAAIAGLLELSATAIPAAISAFASFIATGVTGVISSLGAMATAAIPAAIGALTLLGGAAILAAGAFAGFELGKWLDANVGFMHSFGDAVATFILKCDDMVRSLLGLQSRLPEVVKPTKDLGAEIEKTKSALEKLGVTVEDQGSRTMPQYISYLVDLKVKNGLLAESTETLNQKTKEAEAAHRNLIAQLEADKGAKELLSKATSELKGAESDLASATAALFIPTIEDVVTAQNAVNQSRTEAIAASGNLKQAEADLAAAIKSNNQKEIASATTELATARLELKAATVDLKEKEQDLKASQDASKQILGDLVSGDQALTDAYNAVHIPALKSLSQAYEDVSVARDKQFQAYQELQKALMDEAALDTAGVHNKQALADAHAKVEAAKINLKNATVDLRIEEADQAKTEAALAQSQAQGLKDTQALFDLQQKLHPQYTDINSALKDYKAALNAAEAAGETLRLAEEHRKAVAEGATGVTGDLTQATKDAALADLDLKTKLDAVNKTQQDLTTNFGLSRAQLDYLTLSSKGTASQAELTNAALRAMGIDPVAKLQELANVANDTYAQIAKGGGTATQVRDAHIDAVKATIAVYAQMGVDVPAADQIMLATLEQQEKDYKSNSVTRWTDLQNTIHGTMTGMWSGLTKDFFEGGDFLGTITGALKHVGESILDTLMKPFTDQIDAVLSEVMTKLTTKLSGWLMNNIPGFGITNLTNTAANTAANAGNTAANTAASTAESAGSTAASTAGSIASTAMSFLDPISAVANVVTAVASVLQLFGVGQGGQKDRLNNISDATVSMARMMDAGGGAMNVELLETENTVKYLTGAFTTWYKDQIEDIRSATIDGKDRLTDIFTKWNDPLMDIQNSMKDAVISLKSIQLAASKADSQTVAKAATINNTIQISGNVISNDDFVNMVAARIASMLKTNGVIA